MTDKKYCKMHGKYYEVSRDKYLEYKREQSRHDYLKRAAKDIVLLSTDALSDKEFAGIEIIKVSTAIHAKQLTGAYLPSMIPYGYRKSGQDAYRHETDPETAPLANQKPCQIQA